MKVTILMRCEDSTNIIVKCKNRAEARAAAKKLSQQAHVIGCRLVSMAGKTQAILSHVAKYQKGETYVVPPEVGEELLHLKLAKKAS